MKLPTSSSEIYGGNLLTLVAELATDGQAGFLVLGLLRGREVFGGGTAERRRGPTGQLGVAALGVLVAQAVELAQAGGGHGGGVAVELVLVGQVGGNHRAAPRQLSGPSQHGALLLGANGHYPLLAALGPTGLEADMVLLDGIGRLKLQALLATQAEGPLQLHRAAQALVLDLRQLLRRDLQGLRLVRDVNPVVDAVVGVVPRDDAGLVDLFRPPAQMGQAVFQGPHAQALLLPVLHQRLNVLRLHPQRRQIIKTQFHQIARRQGQNGAAIGLRGVRAIPVAGTDRQQRLFQIDHHGQCFQTPPRSRDFGSGFDGARPV